MSTNPTTRPRIEAAKRSNRLRFHGRRTDTFTHFPFVEKGSRTPSGSWAVPATGGYAGGTLTGEALGSIFLTVLRNNANSDSASFWLGWICSGWLHRAVELAGTTPNAARASQIETLRGQVVGFASSLSYALREGLKHCETPHANADLNKALEDANSGLEAFTAASSILQASQCRTPRRKHQ